MNTESTTTNMPTKNAITAQWRQGVSLIGVGAFTLVLCLVLPPANFKWALVGFSLLIAIGGGWHIDQANKKLRNLPS